MSITLEVQSGSSVPAGSYRAKFLRAESWEQNVKYGPGILLFWEVMEGDHEGQQVSRLCSAKLSPKTNLYKFVTSLRGGSVEVAELIDFDSFTGVEGMVIVEDHGDDGFTRVSAFLRDSEVSF